MKRLPEMRAHAGRFLTPCLLSASLLGGPAAPASADFLFTPENYPYRAAATNSPSCKNLARDPAVLSGPVQNDEMAEVADAWWDCMLQRHVNPRSSNLRRRSAERPIHDPDAYNLAFVEFGDEGQELAPAQRLTLFEHLRAQKQNYVVVFVHGWRNDASRGNRNLKDFRMMLSYAKSALQSRCREAQRYCGATVTGVYIGWRGQSLTSDGDDLLSSAKVAPTIISRKPASEQIANGLASFLKDLDGRLNDHDSASKRRFDRDHMIVIGHSLGGNALITGLGPDFASSIRSHDKSQLMRPPVGNLIVLLNPAAEASKWTRLQDEVAAKGFDAFSPSQPPVLLSLTTTCHYSEAELKDKDLQRKIDCDTATSSIFPIYKVLSLDSWPEQRTTIGNLDPDADPDAPSGHGTTHEYEANGSVHRPTDYQHASDPDYAQCRIGDGWLRYAKERQNWKAGWDAGYMTHVATGDHRFAVDPLNDALYLNAPLSKLDGDQLNALQRRELRTRGQFAHGIYRHDGPVITGPNDPFWNARAIDNAVLSHSGIFSPMTWCALHQLVLDDAPGNPLYAKKNLWKPRTLPVPDAKPTVKNDEGSADALSAGAESSAR